MLHLRKAHYKLIGKAFAALFLLVDSLHNVFHPLFSEELPCLFHTAVKGKASCTGGILRKDNHVVKKINHTVRRMADGNDNLAGVGDFPKLREQLSCHNPVKAGIRLVKDKQ